MTNVTCKANPGAMRRWRRHGSGKRDGHVDLPARKGNSKDYITLGYVRAFRPSGRPGRGTRRHIHWILVIFEPSLPTPAIRPLLAKNNCVDVLRQRRRAELLRQPLVDDDHARSYTDLGALGRIEIFQCVGIHKEERVAEHCTPACRPYDAAAEL
jgi:hypothetical protein